MPRRSLLPTELGTEFSVSAALGRGVTADRLRGRDLERPFRGARLLPAPVDPEAEFFEAQRSRELALIRALAHRLSPGQFISHRSAARLWNVPLPHLASPELHLSSRAQAAAPRVAGAIGHRFVAGRVETTTLDGVPLSAPAATWVTLGALSYSLPQLVAAGDRFVRVQRPGHRRPFPGAPPLTTRDELETVLGLGRWAGAPRLRAALELIREDSWSARESHVRVELVQHGLPEPELNVDVHDEHGFFLACVDMVYRKYRVGVEYHGLLHGRTYARDVERMAALRAEGWEIIEATNETARHPGLIARRTARALIARGWRG